MIASQTDGVVLIYQIIIINAYFSDYTLLFSVFLAFLLNLLAERPRRRVCPVVAFYIIYCILLAHSITGTFPFMDLIEDMREQVIWSADQSSAVSLFLTCKTLYRHPLAEAHLDDVRFAYRFRLCPSFALFQRYILKIKHIY